MSLLMNLTVDMIIEGYCIELMKSKD